MPPLLPAVSDACANIVGFVREESGENGVPRGDRRVAGSRRGESETLTNIARSDKINGWHQWPPVYAARPMGPVGGDDVKASGHSKIALRGFCGLPHPAAWRDAVPVSRCSGSTV